jgi:AcrR family transcriptional regulator
MAKADTRKVTTRAPKQDRSRLSLQRLLETAAEMLESDGYADFTLQHLSQRAKVSIGSIYHLFANKQELVREVQHRTLERIEREHAVVINALRREKLALVDLVPTAIRDYGEFLRRHSKLLRVFMEVAPTDPQIATIGKKYFAQSQRDFELLLLDQQQDIRHPDPEHAVRAAFGVMYAAIGRYLGLGTTPEVVGEGDWDVLLDDISQMMLFFLLGNPRELGS